MEWKKFEDELPTTVVGEQVEILFYGEGWATFFVGLYTHLPDRPERERLSLYDVDVDKYHYWEPPMPTYWIKSPALPK